MEIKYLWVDEILNNGMIGHTEDKGKVFYNLALMGDSGKELEQAMNIKLLLVERDAESVISMGRFICIINMKKDENQATMDLFDCNIYPEGGWQALAELQYPDYVDGFVQIYREAHLSSLSSDTDFFELVSIKPL